MPDIVSTRLDPVVLAIVQRQLDHISRQMGVIMTRTARSPIFSQSHDFSCFLSNGRGETVAQADGLPVHSGGGGFAVRAVLNAFKGDIHPGDVFLSSDPYEAGGNHLPDWTIFRPVFLAGKLIGFCNNRAHQSDIGGGAAGTYNAAATEIFHEGIRLPPLKLIDAGKRRGDLWKLLLLNSRCPELMDGDLGAMLGSTKIGADRMASVLLQLGAEHADTYLNAVLDYGEVRMRQALEELPDGTWSGSDISDTDCFESVDIETRVKVSKVGGEITFDFSGTSPQVKGFKNSGIANTHSAVYVSLSSFMDHQIPRNEGTYRCVKVIAPEGTIVNALPPAPMTMNTVFPAIDIMNACWKALAQVDADRACAGWGKAVYPISTGLKPSGEVFVMYHWHASSGGGAVKGRDGFPSTSHQMTLGGMAIPNVETYEQSYPIHVHRLEFRPDGGGIGEYRGGTSVECDIDVFAGGEQLYRGEGVRRPTGEGINGGGWGSSGSMTLQDLATGVDIDYPQYGVRKVPAMRISLKGSGGGGWGDPLKRDPDAVLRDVRDGVVSHEAALEFYGVEIDPGGEAIASLARRQGSSKAKK